MNGPDLRRAIRRILLSAFLLSLLAGVGTLYLVLRVRAIRKAEQEARVMLAPAAAVSTYTMHNIMPLLSRLPAG